MSTYLAVNCSPKDCSFYDAYIKFSACKTAQMFGILIAIHLCSLGAGLDILISKLLKLKIRESKERLTLHNDEWLTTYERTLDTLSSICNKWKYAHLGAIGGSSYCIFTGFWYLSSTPDLLSRFLNIPLYSLLFCCMMVSVLLIGFADVTDECNSVLQSARRCYRKQNLNQEVEGLMLYLSTDTDVGYKIFNTTIRYPAVQISCFFLAAILLFLLPMSAQ